MFDYGDSGCLMVIMLAIVVFLLLTLTSSFTYGRVKNAKTRDELQEACSVFTIQTAPVRCLELSK